MSGLAQIVPFPVLVGILLVAAALAFPAWLNSVRVRQIKGRLRKAARSHGREQREKWVQDAFKITRDRPRLLYSLADQAIRNGQPYAWRPALDALAATGKMELDLAALRRKVLPPPNAPRDPLQTIVRVERLIEAGLTVAAEEALEQGLSRHPANAELLALRDRMASQG
ncbi:MAG: hypothetical protein AB8H79_14315 [Myxococcota bacterium]